MRFLINKKSLAALAGLAVAACVTINVYFPAAAAEQAADKIINDVLSNEPASSGTRDDETASRADPLSNLLMAAAGSVLNFVVPPAHAQQPDIDISSPGVRRIQASMKARNAQLEVFYESGAVGFTADAMVAVRDLNSVPLRERNTVRQLVADENRDRDALYREIAVANGHPEWEDEIRQVFARRWIARAEPGWYYQQADGSWRQK